MTDISQHSTEKSGIKDSIRKTQPDDNGDIGIYYSPTSSHHCRHINTARILTMKTTRIDEEKKRKKERNIIGTITTATTTFNAEQN